MAWVLPVAAVASTLFAAVGAVQSGQQQQAWSDYNAQVERVRAQEALDQANAQAAIDAQTSKRKLGDAASAYAAAGVDMTGSPLSVMSDLATQGELTRRLTLYKGQIGAEAYQDQAALDTAQGKAAATAGYVKAGTTLLTGASNALGPNGFNAFGGTAASAGQPLTGPVGPGGMLGHA